MSRLTDVERHDDDVLFVNKYFATAHLPERLRSVSFPFSQVAGSLLLDLPPSEQRSLALQKLLEAKDCAVRAAL